MGFEQVAPKLASDIADNVAKAVVNGARGVNNGVVALSVGFANALGNEGDLLKEHTEVARDVRTAVTRSYGNVVTRRKKTESYRIGQNRYSGGALLNALRSSSMAVGTAQGISFVDRDKLNKEARHWQRLNFGARGTGVSNRPAERFRFIYDGTVVFPLQFRQGPRPAFHMPEGMFLSGGTRVGRDPSRRGQDAFQPTSSKMLLKPTRGIEARNFLDAGLRVIAEELPPRYERLFNEWFRVGNQAGLAYMSQIRTIRPDGYVAPLRNRVRIK